MVQRPAATNVTVSPETVHVVVVADAKLTGRPDEAVALTVNGAVLMGSFDNAPNVMVYASLVTVNAWTTGLRLVVRAPIERPEGRQAQNDVIFLENFFDELRRKTPPRGT